MDAKKRARDSSRIVFSDEQTVAQLVSGGEKVRALFEKRLVGVTRDRLYVAGPGSGFHATLCAEATFDLIR